MGKRAVFIAVAIGYAALSVLCFAAPDYLPISIVLFFFGPPLLLIWPNSMLAYGGWTLVVLAFAAVAIRRPEWRLEAVIGAVITWLLAGWFSLALSV